MGGPGSRQERKGPELSELGEAFNDLAAALHESVREKDEQAFINAVNSLAESAQAALDAGSSLGECRRASPYAPIRPVIDSTNHVKWCCTHDPEHCV